MKSANQLLHLSLDDHIHPNSPLTWRNASLSAFLLKLPIEVRLIIYKYAVAASGHILAFPSRVEKIKSKRHRVTASTLALSCRHIYQELTSFPLFYRVNSFSVSNPRDLFRFLTARTPAQRNAIRHLTVRQLTIHPRRYIGLVDVSCAQYLYHPQMLTLLRECRRLQELVVPLKLTSQRTRDMHMLTNCLSIVKKLEAQPSLWNLPAFTFHLVLRDGTVLNLGDKKAKSPLLLTYPYKRPYVVASMIVKIKAMLIIRDRFDSKL
ncbi:hypothetical protein F4779DRAFT_616264 [Xylariaceae sp. FL0662B]|nr:hypothetical protein F4779DRAFT_616264 [Xylariaceae sp. FL0662B]